MNIDEQVRIMEKQIHSEHANFSLFEKMQYLNSYFKDDPEYSKDAINIVISNCCKKTEVKNDCTN